jgi:K+-sensing histidine kinase KdpD
MVLRAGVVRALVHPGTPNEILQSLDETLAQINQMTEMVENLLTLARADEGRAPLAVEESDLREIVADVAETAGMLGENARVSTSHAMPDLPVRLPVDRHRIREMLLNMVTNAIKYTPQGGTIGLSLEEDQDGVTFTVRDTGIGIAAGDLPHIFDRFWRADPGWAWRLPSGLRRRTVVPLPCKAGRGEAQSLRCACPNRRRTTFEIHSVVPQIIHHKGTKDTKDCHPLMIR